MTALEIKEVRLNTFSAYFVLLSLVTKPKIHFIRPKNFGIPHASPLLPRFTSKLLLRRLIYIDDNSVLRLPFVPSLPSPSSKFPRLHKKNSNRNERNRKYKKRKRNSLYPRKERSFSCLPRIACICVAPPSNP